MLFPRTICTMKHILKSLVGVWLMCCRLSAVDSQPIRVLEIQSALRITAEASLGGLATAVPIQLDGIRLIGPYEHAFQKLKELCPPGSLVTLSVPGPTLQPDSFGIVHAWILRDFETPVDPASPTPTPASGSNAPSGVHRTSLQVELIRAGWAVPTENQAQPSYSFLRKREIQVALEEARTRKMGAYSLPGFLPATDESGNPPKHDADPEKTLEQTNEPPLVVPQKEGASGF